MSRVVCLRCGFPMPRVDADGFSSRLCGDCGFEWWPEIGDQGMDMTYVKTADKDGIPKEEVDVPSGCLAVFGEAS